MILLESSDKLIIYQLKSPHQITNKDSAERERRGIANNKGRITLHTFRHIANLFDQNVHDLVADINEYTPHMIFYIHTPRELSLLVTDLIENSKVSVSAWTKPALRLGWSPSLRTPWSKTSIHRHKNVVHLSYFVYQGTSIQLKGIHCS